MPPPPDLALADAPADSRDAAAGCAGPSPHAPQCLPARAHSPVLLLFRIQGPARQHSSLHKLYTRARDCARGLRGRASHAGTESQNLVGGKTWWVVKPVRGAIMRMRPGQDTRVVARGERDPTAQGGQRYGGGPQGKVVKDVRGAQNTAGTHLWGEIWKQFPPAL